jgi:DHA1 family multidrug resistance protein-like MFS transporter
LTAAEGWRRNLAALWFAQFTAVLGFSFAFPFLPLYLRELGVTRPSELALWTGLTGGASGAAVAVMGPIWGAVADRYGRKPMVVRAMVGAAIAVSLMGFARGPVDLLVLRLVLGATSGTVSAATALVATGTPRGHVGWALGVLTSAVAAGSALGPLIGGLAASALGVRAVFWAGGALLAAAVLPVLLVVREVAPPAVANGRRRPALQVLQAAAPGTLAAVGTLIACQALVQSSFIGFQPLVVLRLLGRPSAGAAAGTAAVTGLAFGASGLFSALSSATYSRLARRHGYRTVALGAALLMAAAELLTGYAPTLAAIVTGTALAGAFYGAIGPAVSSMIGLETPAEVQARVFGLSSSATAVGFALGPFSAGVLAARLGSSGAIAVCAAVALALAGVLAFRAREPSR